MSLATRPGGAGLARRARAAALAPLAALVCATCLGDVLHPSTPPAVYSFDAPLSDTIVNIGDTTAPLACHLRLGDRPLDCALEISSATAGRYLSVFQGRLVAIALGTSAVVMRPLSVFLPVDTIARQAMVRSVVPVVSWADGRTTDTLAVGAMKLLLALPETRHGAVIGGAPLQWVQDSGAAFAHVVPHLTGWILADSVGVAVFRAVSDTGSTPPRRIVVIR